MAIATGVPEDDMFISRDELIEEAYRRQGKRIAWVEPEDEGAETVNREADLGRVE